MKKLTFAFVLLAMASWCVTGCQSKGQKAQGEDSTLMVGDTVADSTVYGVCGEGTAMHTVELITDAGDSVTYIIQEDEEGRSCVQGGLLVGDRLAVIGATDRDGERVATKVINLTTLQGKWTSLDNGRVESLDGVENPERTAPAQPRHVRHRPAERRLALSREPRRHLRLQTCQERRVDISFVHGTV